MPIGSRGHVPLIRLAASLNIDTQDRQDKQDENLLHRKLTDSIIECAFVGNLSVLGGPSRTPSSLFQPLGIPSRIHHFAPFTDALAPLVEISSPFPTFGGSLLSLLQPLSGPSSSFVDIFLPFRGNLFPFPTFGRSLLSFLQPLSGPSSFFVALRGYLFAFSWKSSPLPDFWPIPLELSPTP